MELSKLIIIIVVALFILLLVLFPEFRKLCMGWTRLFIKDMATTPEGAEAIYAEKINEAQEKYNKAENALRISAGKLSAEKQKLSSLESELKNVEVKCENLVKARKVEDAQIMAERRTEILADIQRSKKLIDAYTVAKKDAEEVHKACERSLQKLKRESKDVVENMKVKIQLNEVYDSMDELKNVTGTDKLLDSIKEKNNDLNVSVEGARTIYNSKTSTKIRKATENADKLETDNYLNSLMKKYK